MKHGVVEIVVTIVFGIEFFGFVEGEVEAGWVVMVGEVGGVGGCVVGVEG